MFTMSVLGQNLEMYSSTSWEVGGAGITAIVGATFLGLFTYVTS